MWCGTKQTACVVYTLKFSLQRKFHNFQITFPSFKPKYTSHEGSIWRWNSISKQGSIWIIFSPCHSNDVNFHRSNQSMKFWNQRRNILKECSSCLEGNYSIYCREIGKGKRYILYGMKIHLMLAYNFLSPGFDFCAQKEWFLFSLQ